MKISLKEEGDIIKKNCPVGKANKRYRWQMVIEVRIKRKRGKMDR